MNSKYPKIAEFLRLFDGNLMAKELQSLLNEINSLEYKLKVEKWERKYLGIMQQHYCFFKLSINGTASQAQHYRQILEDIENQIKALEEEKNNL